MNTFKLAKSALLFVSVSVMSMSVHAKSMEVDATKNLVESLPVADSVIAKQREMLASNTHNKGFGPQSPRDIDQVGGKNPVVFSTAPTYSNMNLCNIHFHKNAEHKGGHFTTYAGNGNGKGYMSGYKFDGILSKADLTPVKGAICGNDYDSLKPGDTIETHYVHTTAQVAPGPTLGACLSEANKNPQLRVEAQVYVLANNKQAADFAWLAEHKFENGVHQAVNLPNNTGTPVEYAGSTTGPSYNEKGSPFQVTWNVRPEVIKVDINSVDKWCKSNIFNEDHAHGVRNLVNNPELLSPIKN